LFLLKRVFIKRPDAKWQLTTDQETYNRLLEDFDAKMQVLVSEIETMEGSAPPDFDPAHPLKNLLPSTIERVGAIYDCDLSFFDGGEVNEISNDEDEELREPMSVREAKRYDQAAFDRVSNLLQQYRPNA